MICPNCGTQLPADAMFCGECGRAVTPRPPVTGANDTVILERGAFDEAEGELPVRPDPFPWGEVSSVPRSRERAVAAFEPLGKESSKSGDDVQPLDLVAIDDRLVNLDEQPAAGSDDRRGNEPADNLGDEPWNDIPGWSEDEDAAAADVEPDAAEIPAYAAVPEPSLAQQTAFVEPRHPDTELVGEADDLETTRILPRGANGQRFVLQFSTGESITVFGTGLLGRNPQPQPGEYFDQLVAISDPGKSVSKTHLEFGQEAGAFWVSDRFSGNGSLVREPESQPRRCEPGKRYRVVRGSRIDIGEQFFIVS